jgi:quinol monooxygenase YgiN
MIVVLVEVVVEAGAVDKVRPALRAMEEASRKEAGCVGYAFSADVNDSTKVRVTERWRSMDDLKAHMKAPHMAEFQKAVVALKPSALEIKAYEVAREVQLGL